MLIRTRSAQLDDSFWPSDSRAVSFACRAVSWRLELSRSAPAATLSFEFCGRDQRQPQDDGDDQRAAGDEQGVAVLMDLVHLRLAFLLRLADGVTEMVKGKEIEESGSTVVAPCTGLAKYCDAETALIQASEIERLGPGPLTCRLIVPMAAERVPVAEPGARHSRGARRARRSGRGRQLAPVEGEDRRLGRGDGDEAVQRQRPVDGLVEHGRPTGQALGVGLVGRHDQAVLRHLGVERRDVRLELVDVVLLVVDLEELPAAEEDAGGR